MDDRNSIINNSFKNDIDSFIKKTKENTNRLKNKKNTMNQSIIINKTSSKSYNVDLDSNNASNRKNSLNKQSIIRDDEDFDSPKNSKVKGNDSKKFNYLKEPKSKSLSKNAIMKTL